VIRHPCDAQKSWSLRMMDWKEEDIVISDQFSVIRFLLRGDYN